MYRVLKLSGTVYATKINSIEDDLEQINDFMETGDPVIFCNSLDELSVLDIDEDDITTV